MLFCPRLGFAGPAVLIEENQQNYEQDSGGWKNRSKPISEGKSILQHYSDQTFNSTYDLRLKRKVGIGAAVAGAVGVYGGLIELNFAPDDSVVTGFGGGPRFNSFMFQWKHLLGNTESDGFIHPYLGFGYSRWFSVSGNNSSMAKTTPSFLGSRFLSEEEKITGRFEKNLLIPSLGLQYFQLDGEYRGLGVFVEVDVILETSDLSPVPTGGVGTIYYF
jgi:hypothetical protein